MQDHLNKLKKQLASKSTKELVRVITEAGLRVPGTRKEKIQTLISLGESRYREAWKTIKGFDIEITKNPEEWAEFARLRAGKVDEGKEGGE